VEPLSIKLALNALFVILLIIRTGAGMSVSRCMCLCCRRHSEFSLTTIINGMSKKYVDFLEVGCANKEIKSLQSKLEKMTTLAKRHLDGRADEMTMNQHIECIKQIDSILKESIE